MLVFANKEEERAFTRRYVRKAWARTWRIMLGKNIFACLRDTAVGVDAIARHPARATAARTGPHRPLDLGDDTGGQESFKTRRPAGNAVGTVNTPVVVLSPRSNMAKYNASV